MKNKFKVCSLCVNSKKLFDMNDNKLKNNNEETQQASIETKILYCLDIKMDSSYLSNMICKKCVRLLDQYYTFKLQAAGIQSFLKAISQTCKSDVEPQAITDSYNKMKKTINLTTTLKSKKRKKLKKKSRLVANSESESCSEYCDDDSVSSNDVIIQNAETPKMSVEDVVSTTEDVPNTNVSSSTSDELNSVNVRHTPEPEAEKNECNDIEIKGLTNSIQNLYPCEFDVNNINTNLIDKIIQDSGALNELPPDADINDFLEETTNKIMQNIIKFKASNVKPEPTAIVSDEGDTRIECISDSESDHSEEPSCSSFTTISDTSKTCDYNAIEIIDIDSDDESDADETYTDIKPVLPQLLNDFAPVLVERSVQLVFFCSFCSDNFNDELKLKKHVRQRHENRCIPCRKSFGTKIALKYHQIENMCLRVVLVDSKIPSNCDWKLNYKPVVKLIQFADPNNFKINLTKINKKLRRDVLYSIDFTRQRKQKELLLPKKKDNDNKKVEYDAHQLRPSTLSSREFSFHNEHVLYYSKVSEHFFNNKFNATDLNNTTWSSNSSDGTKDNSIKLRFKKVRSDLDNVGDEPPAKKSLLNNGKSVQNVEQIEQRNQT